MELVVSKSKLEPSWNREEAKDLNTGVLGKSSGQYKCYFVLGLLLLSYNYTIQRVPYIFVYPCSVTYCFLSRFFFLFLIVSIVDFR